MRKNVIIWLLLLTAYGSTAQTYQTSKSFAKVAATPAGVPSSSDTIVLNYTGFSTNPKLITSFPFELSLDGNIFNDTIVSSSVSDTVYVRTIPNQVDAVFRGTISVWDSNFVLGKKIQLLGSSILPNESLSMCTWNLKWFGEPAQCSCDTALARINVSSVLKELEVDVIALQEVVNIGQLQQLVTDMGSHYNYVIADYASQIPNASISGYHTAQKQAFIYNQQTVSQLNSFGLLRSTYPVQQGISSPYYYFASGRWPFGMHIQVNSTSEDFYFFNLHGKAFAGSSEHNRRAGGALKMTDSINALWPNKNIIVLGDYNDKLEGAITSGFTISPYSYAMNNGFKGITLPSLFPGETTYLGSSVSLIDNYMISNSAFPYYIPNSTIILREVDMAIDNYKSTTSDHLPVLSFLKRNNPTAINRVDSKGKQALLIQPNGKELRLLLPREYKELSVCINSLDGKRVFYKKYSHIQEIKESLKGLCSGVYIVRLYNFSTVETFKWLVD